jgi:4-hydroxy-tetrahydrodipicolinate reductase
MSAINVMINGLPGNVARVIAEHAQSDGHLNLIPYALTGPEITATQYRVGTLAVDLIRPDERDARIAAIISDHAPFITVDYSHPAAVNANAEFYCRHGLPFVMGTTGGDREKLMQTVLDQAGLAVIAPNMSKQIVGFQAMMAYAAENFPNLFKGYQLTIRESHQSGKADTSGTAKAMVEYFNRMGIPFDTDQIHKERNPESQRTQWGIPEAHLGGHAWHTYALTSADGNTHFEFTHNINGRDVYFEGTRDAARFLADKVTRGINGKIYSMIDVLKAGASL